MMDLTPEFPTLSSVVQSGDPSSRILISCAGHAVRTSPPSPTATFPSAVTLIDELDQIPVPSVAHLAIDEIDDQATIKSLSAQILALKQQLSSKDEVIHSMGNHQGKATEQPKWSSVVAQSSSGESPMTLSYFPPVVTAEKPVVYLPPSVEAKGCQQWADCVVGYFLDKKVHFKLVKDIVTNIWRKFGIYEVLSNDRGFYFFKFSHGDAIRKLIEAGPWLIAGKLMILKPWRPQMSLEKKQLSKIPIWEQFSSIPLEFWNEEGLSRIASAIGVPLYADDTTENCQRLSFARICVEVDVRTELLDSVEVVNAAGVSCEIPVKYSWKPIRCSKKAAEVVSNSTPIVSDPSGPEVGSTGAVAKVILEGGSSKTPHNSSGIPCSPQLVINANPSRVGRPNGLRSPLRPSGIPRIATPVSHPKVLPCLPQTGGDQKSTRLQICDDAAIEQVVNRYSRGPDLVVDTKPGMPTLVDSFFPSENDLGDIGFITSPSASNRFSPLSGKVVEATGATSSSVAPDVVDSMPGHVDDVLPLNGKAVAPPLPKGGRAKARGKGGNKKS
ncbi:hypothetical protein RHMOL_Rhmol08G0141500 [Rhododendron molle]|uniref:Uncharacterized protein n=1 Tax=Rhododendron molle TaxID=49168 RepID=A0ACC0MPS9_RHOML|nr:hypothetical protein RHMOL_Rhmol08G0141500 [Rhododendron molle]